MDARDEEDPFGRSKDVVVRETQIARVRKELEALKVECAFSRVDCDLHSASPPRQSRVEKEREKFAKISEKAEVIAMEPPFKVNTSQLLDPESASYKISVEIPFPIDVVRA
jgi:hypothetical protein